MDNAKILVGTFTSLGLEVYGGANAPYANYFVGCVFLAPNLGTYFLRFLRRLTYSLFQAVDLVQAVKSI
jgi:hypothetical protein